MNEQNEQISDIFPLSEQTRKDLQETGLSLTRGVDGFLSKSPYYGIDEQTKQIIVFNVSLSDNKSIEYLVKSAKANLNNYNSNELPSEAYY